MPVLVTLALEWWVVRCGLGGVVEIHKTTHMYFLLLVASVLWCTVGENSTLSS